jgi:hypothetical protein
MSEIVIRNRRKLNAIEMGSLSVLAHYGKLDKAH